MLTTSCAAAAIIAYLAFERRRSHRGAAAFAPVPAEDAKASSPDKKPANPTTSSTPSTSARSRTRQLVATEHHESRAPEDATAELANIRRKLAHDNKEVVRAWEKREWAKAAARMEAKRAAREAADVPDPVREKTKELLAARRARQAEGEETMAAELRPSEGTASLSGPTDSPAGATGFVPRGATAATIAAELQRWPRPPAASGCTGALETRDWPLYYDHFDWLDDVAARYAFADAGEALRHLVFVANGEAAPVKKLIFKVIRCLHCHSGTRAGHIPKKEKPLALFDFQLVWLHAVQAQCSHPTVEKTIRILCDYYRKQTSDHPAAEAELFWRKRANVTARRIHPSGHIPGVPGNFFCPETASARAD